MPSSNYIDAKHSIQNAVKLYERMRLKIPLAEDVQITDDFRLVFEPSEETKEKRKLSAMYLSLFTESINKLTQEEREIIARAFIWKEPNEEIAYNMGLSTSTISKKKKATAKRWIIALDFMRE